MSSSTRKDSDPVIVCSGSNDDFISIFTDMIKHIQFKLFGLIFILFLILMTDVFINRVLSQFNGAVDGRQPTSYGILLLGLFLMIGCVVLDATIRQGIV
jgi:hypothetical protein